MTGGDLLERRVVYQVNLVGERRNWWTARLRVRRDSEIGQREQDDMVDASVVQCSDRLVDVSAHARHKRLHGLKVLGQLGKQERVVVIAADIDQRGGVVRRLVAVELRQ